MNKIILIIGFLLMALGFASLFFSTNREVTLQANFANYVDDFYTNEGKRKLDTEISVNLNKKREELNKNDSISNFEIKNQTAIIDIQLADINIRKAIRGENVGGLGQSINLLKEYVLDEELLSAHRAYAASVILLWFSQDKNEEKYEQIFSGSFAFLSGKNMEEGVGKLTAYGLNLFPNTLLLIQQSSPYGKFLLSDFLGTGANAAFSKKEAEAALLAQIGRVERSFNELTAIEQSTELSKHYYSYLTRAYGILTLTSFDGFESDFESMFKERQMLFRADSDNVENIIGYQFDLFYYIAFLDQMDRKEGSTVRQKAVSNYIDELIVLNSQVSKDSSFIQFLAREKNARTESGHNLVLIESLSERSVDFDLLVGSL